MWEKILESLQVYIFFFFSALYIYSSLPLIFILHFLYFDHSSFSSSLHLTLFNHTSLDSNGVQGQCGPRLCGKGRVFVGEDGLFHDSESPFACRGGRKQYYTAYGDPICDCQLGQYPFPEVNDDCVTLFTQDNDQRLYTYIICMITLISQKELII